MAHHQGMNLVAINNFIHKGIMQNRFHSEQMIHATQLLLEEKRYSYFIHVGPLTERGIEPRCLCPWFDLGEFQMVGAGGFEPPTPSVSS